MLLLALLCLHLTKLGIVFFKKTEANSLPWIAGGGISFLQQNKIKCVPF